MSNNEADNIFSKKELKEAIQLSLKYLIEEGVVLKEGKKYRLKTKKEIKKELNDILSGVN